MRAGVQAAGGDLAAGETNRGGGAKGWWTAVPPSQSQAQTILKDI